MSWKRSNKVGNRWARLTNFQSDIILTQEDFDAALANRIVNTWEWAEMCENGWTKPRKESTLQDYRELMATA